MSQASLKERFRGQKITTFAYPLSGATSSGTGKITLDLIRQGIRDNIETLSVRLVGNVVVAGGGGGTASGAYNPNGLFVNTSLQTTPTVNQLLPINNVSSRIMVIDRALRQKAFQFATALTDAAGTQALDVWQHFTTYREHAKQGVEFELPMNRWSSAVLNLTLGTIDQLFTGSASTYNLSGVTVEIWGDLDVSVDPPNIHAVEMFEIPLNITATNAALDFNNLPQGCFYDDLIITSEVSGALADGVINNIYLNSGGRIWTEQDNDNAAFIRERWTRPWFYDPTTQNNLRGIYIIPLRHGRWSNGFDAIQQLLDIKFNVTFGGSPTIIRIAGRKVVPFGIKQTVRGPNGQKTVTNKVPIIVPAS
jgi:hypothetical protein